MKKAIIYMWHASLDEYRIVFESDSAIDIHLLVAKSLRPNVLSYTAFTLSPCEVDEVHLEGKILSIFLTPKGTSL